MDLTKQFFKYVSQNIFGLLGTSCYILADTYFIAQAAGTDGVTLLNLCLPIYNFIFAIGSMIALGSATRYAIAKAQNDARGQRYFSNAILCAVLASIPWMLAGVFAPGALLRLMGGDAGIVTLGIPYARIFLLFTPFFMCNYIVSAFVRNDGGRRLLFKRRRFQPVKFQVMEGQQYALPRIGNLSVKALQSAVGPGTPQLQTPGPLCPALAAETDETSRIEPPAAQCGGHADTIRAHRAVPLPGQGQRRGLHDPLHHIQAISIAPIPFGSNGLFRCGQSGPVHIFGQNRKAGQQTPGSVPVSYTHLTLPTICSV